MNDLADGECYHPACARKFFGTKEPPGLNYTLEDMKDLARKIVRSRSVVTGVQPKISLGLQKAQREGNRLTLMAGEFILKPPSSYYQAMPETEDLTMHLAAICNISTVPHALIPLASGELAYITRRVDRSNGGKVHMEDFCQLSELLTEDKYKSSMERVGKVIEQYSMAPGLDLINLFELTLFNFVTGNNDMHLKNFSLINSGIGWHLSPAYDLLNVNLINEMGTEETALTIRGKKRKLQRQDFLELGESYKLTSAQIRNAFEHILESEKRMTEFVEISFLSDELKTKYIEIVRARCLRLRERE
jgi:serine/threonine-protein kinase HipA